MSVPKISVPVIDGHVDLVYDLMRRGSDAPFEQVREGAVTLAGAGKAGIRVLVIALFCPDHCNGPASSGSYLNGLLQWSKRHLEILTTIHEVSTLKSCFSGQEALGRISLLENSDALLDCGVDVLRKWGIPVVGLTHAGGNRIGDGNAVAHPTGFTKEGRLLLSELQDGGFAVDTAHLSDPCLDELLDRYEGPVCSSHTGFKRFCPKPRNLSNKHIRSLVRRGGVVGLTVNPEMLSPDGVSSIQEVFRQLDWFVETYGYESLALGSDFGGFDHPAHGLEDVSKLVDLACRMETQGYPEPAVRSIMGENWYAFYSRLLASRNSLRS